MLGRGVNSLCVGSGLLGPWDARRPPWIKGELWSIMIKRFKRFKTLRIALPVAAFALAFVMASSWSDGASAQRRTSQQVAAANQGTVGVITGGFGSTNLRIVADLATVLNEKHRLRVLPMIGQGSVQNIDDILHLRGIDVGIVQSDVFAHLKQQASFVDIENRVNYISKLFNVEFHLIAGKKIRSIKDLAGKKVSFGVDGSGTFITATAVFKGLGVNVRPVHLDFALAVHQLKAGKIDAIAYVSGKPASAVRNLRHEDGLHLVAVNYVRALRGNYFPAFLTSKDYPGLIGRGDRVPSVSVGTIMAVYNWERSRTGGRGPRTRKVKRFIDAFFSRYKELAKPPRHPKWREMNIAAEVPGWIRYKPAQQRLDEELKKRRDGS